MLLIRKRILEMNHPAGGGDSGFPLRDGRLKELWPQEEKCWLGSSITPVDLHQASGLERPRLVSVGPRVCADLLPSGTPESGGIKGAPPWGLSEETRVRKEANCSAHAGSSGSAGERSVP